MSRKYRTDEEGIIVKQNSRRGTVIIQKKDGDKIEMPWSAIIGLTQKVTLLGLRIQIARLNLDNRIIAGKIVE